MFLALTLGISLFPLSWAGAEVLENNDGFDQNPSEQIVNSSSSADMQEEAKSDNVSSLQFKIDFLPTTEELQKLDNDSQLNAYSQAQSIADEYESMTTDEQNQLNITKLEQLMEYFNRQVSESKNNWGHMFWIQEDSSWTLTMSNYTVTNIKLRVIENFLLGPILQGGDDMTDIHMVLFNYKTKSIVKDVSVNGEYTKDKPSNIAFTLSLDCNIPLNGTDRYLTVGIYRAGKLTPDSAKQYSDDPDISNWPSSISCYKANSGYGTAFSIGSAIIGKGASDGNVPTNMTLKEYLTTDQRPVPKVTVTPASGLKYNGNNQELLAIASTTGGTLQYKLGQNGTYSTNKPTASEVGSYKVFYKVDGGADYKSVAENSVDIDIAKGDPAIMVTPAPNLVYKASNQELLTTATTTAGTLKFKLGKDGTYNTTKPTAKQAGEYEVFYKVDGNEHYNDVAEASVKVIISPKSITVKAKDMEKGYLEEDPELEYEVLNDGLEGDDTLSNIKLTREDGEDVKQGGYVITAIAEAQDNPNYTITFENGTFTINPMDISGADVKLGEALRYTGEEQTQEVLEVAVGDTVVPKDSYEITENTATDAGAYKLLIKAKEETNFTGERSWSFVVAPNKKDQVEEEDKKDTDEDGSKDDKTEYEIGDGKIVVSVKSEAGAPVTELDMDKAEVIDMLVGSEDISADELSKVADGSILNITWTVKDNENNIDAVIKEDIKASAANVDFQIGQYLDISLNKSLSREGEVSEVQEISQLADNVSFKLEIPESLINNDEQVIRTYDIARNHDGQPELLNGTYNDEEKVIKFETDSFSDYAIAYSDVPNPTMSASSMAATGDQDMWIYFIIGGLLIVSAIVLISRVLRKQK